MSPTVSPRSVTRSTVVSLLVFGLAWGCSKNPKVKDPSGGDAGPDAIQYDVAVNEEVSQFVDFTDELKRAACAKAFECCSSTERKQVGLETDSKDSCGREETSTGLIGLDQYRNAMRSGNLEFDEELGKLCIESLEKRPCEEFNGSINPFQDESYAGCSEALEPVLEQGEACQSDFGCTTGYCKTNEGSDPDRCQRLPTAGEACPDRNCAAGFYCDDYRREPTCAKTKSSGESCDGNRECESGLCESGSCATIPSSCDGS